MRLARQSSYIHQYQHNDNIDINEHMSYRKSFPELPNWLTDRCEQLGYINPTDVQQLALPSVFEGKDVILQAQTGSG